MPIPLSEHPVIAVIGAGAVGGYYGAMLARRGFDVHFLARADYAVLRERGLRIESYKGDFQIAPQKLHVHDHVAKMPPADLVIVALKATSNHLFESLIAPLLKPQAAILTMQNGLGNEEELANLFGADRVMGGMAFVCNMRIGPGVIRHASEGWVRLGEFSRAPIERTHQIGKMLSDSGVECRVIENLQQGRWEKILWNIPFNGLGTVMDLSTDRLLATPQGTELVTALMKESMSIASRLGFHWPADWIEQKLEMTRRMGAYKTSMQIDREHGRPLEIEAIVGKPLAKARALGINAPLIEMVYRLLRLL